MINNDSVKVMALVSALTAGSPATAQTNRLQEGYRRFLTEEFRKADKNPQDFFISQEELNNYMGNPDTNVEDFDTTSDGLLNIDEFKSILTGEKGTQSAQQPKTLQTQSVQQAKDQQLQTLPLFYYPQTSLILSTTNKFPNSQMTSGVKSKTRSVEPPPSGHEIYKELIRLIEHPEPKVVPGILWGTRTIHPIDKNKLLATYKKINADNLKDVLQDVDGTSAYNRFARLYTRVYRAYYGSRTEVKYEGKLFDHMIKIIEDLAKKNGNAVLIAHHIEQLKHPSGYEWLWNGKVEDAFNAAISGN